MDKVLVQLEPMPLYKLSKEAVLETFDDGGLVLIVPERRLVELNLTAVEIVNLLDGYRTEEQVAVELAKNHNIGHDILIRDVHELCKELNQTGILDIQPDLQENLPMTEVDPTRYLSNPDVVLREEDPDEGALLFNPDTNQVKVVNTTGLFIWKQFETPQQADTVVRAIRQAYDDVPEEQIVTDVQEFINEMLQTGFLGSMLDA